MNVSDVQQIKLKYGIVGRSPALDRALDIAIQVAPTDLSVLIVGESGVGKETIPRIIHDYSSRKHNKFFAINCGSIPEGTIDSELFGHEKGAFTGAVGEREGYFGAANNGTLFLDEVGELPMATQARLLRVLETGEYIRVGSSDVRKTNVRIVAATNVNMRKAISEGRFREDLFYRLNTIPISVPPLRERKDDILLLFRKFAADISEKYGMPPIRLTDDAKDLLMQYTWPGNIRQLKNLTEQISVVCKEREITKEILSGFINPVEQQGGIVPVNNGAHSYENEREILYRVLFDLRKDVNDLKEMVHSNVNNMTSVHPMTQSPVPVVNDPYSGKHADGMSDFGSLEPTKINISPATEIKIREPHPEHDVEFAETIEETPLSMKELERRNIIQTLERCHGKRKKAAKELGISERTLYRKIKEYDLDL